MTKFVKNQLVETCYFFNCFLKNLYVRSNFAIKTKIKIIPFRKLYVLGAFRLAMQLFPLN